MKIHRSHPRERFTIIPDETLRDPRLSYLARGVLAEMLSRPDNWQASADGTAVRAQAERGRAGEGRRGIRAVFGELAAAGYLHRVRSRAPDGRLVTDLHVYDCPHGSERSGESSEPSVTGGTSVPPAETGISPGQTGDHPGGTSGPPAETHVFPVRTDVPLTDRHPGGTSLRRPTTETTTTETARFASPRTETETGGPLGAPASAEQMRDRNGAAPQSLRDRDAPEDHGADDQQQPSEPHAGAQPQTVTRADGTAPPGRLASDTERAAWQAAESRKRRQADDRPHVTRDGTRDGTRSTGRDAHSGSGVVSLKARRQAALRQRIGGHIASNPGCTGNDLQAAIGGNRDHLLTALRQLMDDGQVTRYHDPADKRIRRYSPAVAS